MLSRAARALPVGLRAVQQPQAFWASMLQQAAGFSELNLSDRQTLKKFVGIEDLLGHDPDARGTLRGLLHQLRDAVAAQLPASADYRRAVEATVAYRLKVLDANESDAAAEEVLDSHLEELILETREELNLVPIVAGARAFCGEGCGGERRLCVLPFALCIAFGTPLSPPPLSPPTTLHSNPITLSPTTHTEQKPWDVPADHTTPVFDYASADQVLSGGGASGGGGAAAAAPPPPPPPPK